MSFKVKAIYDYNSGHEDDLPFSIGQIITVTDQEDADWYGGEYVDDNGVKQEGIFPRNFVEKYEPTAPPRPTRTRTKNQLDQPQSTASEAPAPPFLSPKLPEPEPEAKPTQPKVTSPTRTTTLPPPAPAAAPEASASRPEPAEVVSPPPPKPAQAQAPAPQPAVVSPPAPKPAPTQSKPAGPPPVSEKPSSFKDRIAAFNKSAAPPIAPFKPSGLGSGSQGFIKKPFVAPPPSRNSYVPPVQSTPVAKVYRRDEDPEIKEREAENMETAEKAGLVPGSGTADAPAEGDEPKPMSLKERLALLQKQQMEAAQRHSDAVAKKEKPKRPPKKRMESYEAGAEESEASIAPLVDRRDSEDVGSKKSLDESHPPRVPHPPRRKSSKGPEPRDGNEADMSGAGEMTEGQEDDLTEREESDERSRHVATAAKQDDEPLDEEEENEDEEDDDVDPEVRRKEELRARMARIAGGMTGMAGIFGGPMPSGGAPAPPKKKKSIGQERHAAEAADEAPSPSSHAPPVPMMMALPGMSRVKSHEEARQQDDSENGEEEDERDLRTPHQESAPPTVPARDSSGAPPIPAGRPAPPPVPTDSRPAPPLPPPAVQSPSVGSQSDDELSERPELPTPGQSATSGRAPPPLPPVAAPPPMLPNSPTSPNSKRQSYMGDALPTSPTSAAPPLPPSGNKRASRLPPPVPGAAPAIPPSQTRAPPPPPPGALSRSSTADTRQSMPPTRMLTHEDNVDEDEDEEVTEYEGDYDTDIASSAPHKDALKSHQRESSFEDATPVRSPVTDAPPSLPPPIPSASAPRGPPPIPSQPPPESYSRKSTDVPRAAPPPPPPKETPSFDDDDYDPFNYAAPIPAIPTLSHPPPPPPPGRPAEDPYQGEATSPFGTRGPPPAAPSNRAPPHPRQSLDVQRPTGRRSVDVTRPSMESGYVANELDLASQTGWWLKPNSVPPRLQGRKDIYFESEESTASQPGGKTTITRDIYVLYQDYSQTVITVRFDPKDQSDAQLSQRHEPPPRVPRQDQLEQAYERFGRAMSDAVSAKQNTVVGDGTPQALVHELLRPHPSALLPVGTRAYGALVYSNLANASTVQNDEIRPGDILSVRNAKFQGKHGPMHAKYSVEVGKPDHVGVVAEWDGTKRKVRVWEQGRESRKVKVESFKLDDLRSGEVRVWRVMGRGWVGWEGGGD